jgi:hypothetical protein
MTKFGEGGHVGGRPRGARNRLASEFLEALLADFKEGGAAAIKVARIEDPVRYLAVMASLMPKELAVEHSQLGDLSDDEVSALLDYVREQRAKLIEAKPEPRMISKKRPKGPPAAQDVAARRRDSRGGPTEWPAIMLTPISLRPLKRYSTGSKSGGQARSP